MIPVPKYKLYYLIPIVLLGILFISNSYQNPTTPKEKTEKVGLENSKFLEYWFQGKAELTSYELVQARYGELHQGTAVLVFVTEPFSKTRQVKVDDPHQNKEDIVNVLKLNFNKKFITGIYDYSMLQSIFTPIEWANLPKTIKVSSSVQEWCGHTFMQLNLQKNQYRVQLNSYFDGENDKNFQIKQAILEDEVWNLIRIAPEKLPTGKIEMIPGLGISRLQHTALEPELVEATLKENINNKEWNTYSLNFTKSNRQLVIHFNKTFPYEIMGWEDTYNDFGKILTTKAIKKKTILSAYWNYHDTASGSPLRKELELN